MKFQRRKLEIDIYGESVEMRFPTVRESQGYGDKMKKAGEEKAGDMLLDFLSDLGLPKNIAESMEAEHLTELMEALIPAKKK